MPTAPLSAPQLPVRHAAATPGWSIEQSEDLYRIDGWGKPYFSINTAGHITVSPKGERGRTLDLYELVEGIRQRGLSLPLLIRFSDILEDRLERLTACFDRAIARYDYDGDYRGVFPIKCNQQRHLVEDLVRFGKPYRFGLEVGSKPELMIALAVLDTPGALLVCNGYKDLPYVETALLGQRLGQQPILVIEKLEEVDLIIQVSQRLGIHPMLGIRAKLSAKGLGRWEGTGGDRGKFGLTVPEILSAVERLRTADLLPCLQLLHFHIGSQISAISVIKDALREASQIYVELAALGAKMGYLDVGGGLAVDYSGAKNRDPASKNYSMQNYANDVVAEVKEACATRGLAVPTLISESGRAIAAHQSVLVFDVLGVSQIQTTEVHPPAPEEHAVIRELYETYCSIGPDNYQEAFHDAEQFKQEATGLFNFGYFSLVQRGQVESLYWACCDKIARLVEQEDSAPDDFKGLRQAMASTYHINLSIFQSAPDSWAIDQLFPIMPIHRLNEAPTQAAKLADLTCDSDGKVDRFIGQRAAKQTLELHPVAPQETYYLGMFLTGAYQEIMGSLHNLFGDTNAVHIRMTSDGHSIEHVVKGDTLKHVLKYVQYDAEDLAEQIRQRSEAALRNQKITIAEARLLLKSYENSLSQYTYLSKLDTL